MTADVAAPRFSEAALAEYREILARYPTRRAALMPTLWLAQREFGYLPVTVQQYVADLMELPLAWVSSVVSFYTMYWTEPPARWRLQICRNLSCALRGGLEICDAISAKLGIRHGERTPDGRFSLEEVECLASCGTAPCLQVNNGTYYENLTVESALALVDRLANE
ncbi:MAG TPA: NAD(P)H-dependent oxidoreductase subunit E [Candidatus Limnocylindria bacterium]|nr:NAD(P)H-dependent oxidoreductase subunit E [Candidatus Limnocylindria bacterium]